MARLTDAEKERRKHERKAAKMNAAEAKAYGPLFAEMAPTYTAEDAYRKWRLGKAAVAELHFHYGLEWIQLQAIERHAVKLMGDVAKEIAAHIRRVYPMPDYGPHMWSEVLTTKKRIVYRYKLLFDPARIREHNSDGRYLVDDGVWEAEPVMTRDEFKAMFPAVARMGDVAPEPPTADDVRMEAVLEILKKSRC